jgi:hypothetical protein
MYTVYSRVQIFLLLCKLEHITTILICILNIIPIYSTFVGVALVQQSHYNFVRLPRRLCRLYQIKTYDLWLVSNA